MDQRKKEKKNQQPIEPKEGGENERRIN